MQVDLEKFGPWALITGASSGLGAEFARQLAPSGMNLALTARRKGRLDSLAEELSDKYDIKVETIKADLSTDNFIHDIREVTDPLGIGLLINNAGFALTGAFLSNSLESELDLFHVNSRAPLILAHKFGRHMALKKKGGIIFVSSLVASTAAPFWLGYSSSKVHNLYTGLSLWGELRKQGVAVQVLCPGPTSTEFGKVAGISSGGRSMPVEKVVAASLKNLGRKPIVIPGVRNKTIYFLSRLLPKKINAIIVGKGISKMKQKA